jgi:hypothetical protein
MQHLDEGTIHSWLDGALSSADAARAEAHVAECPQCAAAVAEARGFIAASSRILTALDNAPRGVIPVAAPVKRMNPLVWRVAATVLVVAAGTLVVVQNRETTEPLKAVSENQTTILSQPTEEAVPPRGSDAATAAAANAALPKATVSKTLDGVLGEAPGRAAAVASAKKAATSNFGSGVTTGAPKAPAERALMRDERTAVVSDLARAPAPAARVTLSGVAAGAAMDAAIQPEMLKVVSDYRQTGAKVTLYEVTPGDTVTLTESIPAALKTIRIRGTTSMAPQATGKTAAAPSRDRTDAVTAAVPESRRTGEVAAAAPAMLAPPPTAQTGTAMTVHTITWTDPATGSRLMLSGRMPESRLQEIRIRIERDRAEAAAAAKKNP